MVGLALGLVPASAATQVLVTTSNIAQIIERSVASIPVGPDPALNISDEPCPEGGSCEAGVTAVAENGDVYFYDYGHSNIKLIRAQIVRTIPGRDGRPIDMAVADETVYLLFDAWRLPHRFVVYARAPNDTDWVRLPFSGPDSIGTADIPGLSKGRMLMANTARLYCALGGTAYVYDRFENRSYPVGTRAHALDLAEQIGSSFDGIVGPDGSTFRPDNSGVASTGWSTARHLRSGAGAR